MGQTHSAASLAAQITELQGDLVIVLGAEQRALELAGNYRALSAEQDTAQARELYLTAEVQQRLMAAGYAKHACRIAAEIRAAHVLIQRERDDALIEERSAA